MKNQNTVPEPLNRNHTTSPRRSQPRVSEEHGCTLPKLYHSFTDFTGGLPKPYQNFTGWEKTILFPSFSHPKMGGCTITPSQSKPKNWTLEHRGQVREEFGAVESPAGAG